MTVPERRLRLPLWLCLALGLVLAAQISAYWPGLMTWDAVRQYREALRVRYDDWHPPAMDWLWGEMRWFHSGPGPMLVLQLLLYWGGFAGLIGWALGRDRRGLAIGLAFAAAMPISLALMGAVLKDCLMAGALVAVVALLAFLPKRGGWWLRAPALALLIGAATLRFNALPACLPLMIAALPGTWWRGRWRFAVALMVSSAVLALAMPVANRLLRAEPSGVGLSLVIFDLAGITYHSGVDVFPDIDVDNRVAVNARCYTPSQWDRYAFWSPEPCPIQFDDIGAAFLDSGESPYRHWLAAVAHHPLAYAAHRLAHFNINTRFLVRDEVERAGQLQSAPNPWGYSVGPNAARTAIEWLSLWGGRTPLGWPVWWMALALGALILAPRLPSRGLIVPVALSGLLYGTGYLAVSVAAELRYNLWTMIASAIAILIVASDCATGGWPRRRRMIGAAAPVVAVTILCVIWRIG